MSWFRVDDGFDEHAKLELLTDPAEHAHAVAAWTLCGSACARRLTDGVVTRASFARVLGTWPEKTRLRAAASLVRVGLWHEHADGWEFHDWRKYQPSRADVTAQREAAAERQRRLRGKPVTAPVTPNVTRDEQRDTDRDSRCDETVSHATPSRPDPSRPDPDQNSSRGSALDQVAPAPADPRDTLASAWRVGFVKRFERIAGGTHGGPAGAHMAALIDAAVAQRDPAAFVERSLDGFFSTPRHASSRPPFPVKYLAEDPVGYAATATTPSGASSVRNSELVNAIPRAEVP